ncbi:hypothetical protein BJ165DRAFT_1524266 [Panaeolus papilionaceus]|nr:hypothetical protein BJ165DRAFT_1524266 [Panaeolus papilionaceus]
MSSSSGLRAPSQSSSHRRNNRSNPSSNSHPYTSSGRSKKSTKPNQGQQQIPTGFEVTPLTTADPLTEAANTVISLARSCVFVAFFDTFSFHGGTPAILDLARFYMPHILQHSGVGQYLTWNEDSIPDQILAAITSKVEAAINRIHESVMDVVEKSCVKPTTPIKRQDMKKAYLSKHTQAAWKYVRIHPESDQVDLNLHSDGLPSLGIDFVQHCVLQHDTVGIVSEDSSPSQRRSRGGPEEYKWFCGVVPRKIVVLIRAELERVFKQWKTARRSSKMQPNVTEDVFLDQADSIRQLPEFILKFGSHKSFRHWDPVGPYEFLALTQELGITALQCLVPDPLSSLSDPGATRSSSLGLPSLKDRVETYNENLFNFKILPVSIRGIYKKAMQIALESRPQSNAVGMPRIVSASKTGWSSPVDDDTFRTLKSLKEATLTERDRYLSVVGTLDDRRTQNASVTVNSEPEYDGEGYANEWKSLLASALVMGFGRHVAQTLDTFFSNRHHDDQPGGGGDSVYCNSGIDYILGQFVKYTDPDGSGADISALRRDKNIQNIIVALSSLLNRTSPQSTNVVTEDDVEHDLYLDLVVYDTEFLQL